jgi:hypothetical protein
MLCNKGNCSAQRNKILILISKYFTPLFVWDVMMFTSGFTDGIFFSKELYASICKLDCFPKDAGSLFVQHTGNFSLTFL